MKNGVYSLNNLYVILLGAFVVFPAYTWFVEGSSAQKRERIEAEIAQYLILGHSGLTDVTVYDGGNYFQIKVKFKGQKKLDKLEDKVRQQVIKELKSYLLDRVCTHPKFIYLLENRRYITIDVKDKLKPKSRLNILNLTIKLDRCIDIGVYV